MAAVEESVKEMNSMLNGADDTAILTALMSQVILSMMVIMVMMVMSVPNTALAGSNDRAMFTCC